jgi:hypothetical protein
MTANRFRFRAWDNKHRKMLTSGAFAVQCGEARTEEMYNLHGGFELRHNRNLILMQSCGLLDAKGKEIFEGDILEWDGSAGHWDKEWFCVEWSAENHGWSTNRQHFLIRECSVVGNIYENPELLGHTTKKGA